MASIEERRNSVGTITSYRVVWRHAGRKLQQSFPERGHAEQWVHLLSMVKGDPSKAQSALLKARSKAPTFKAVATQHLDRLLNVQPLTIQKYESYLRNHLHLLVDVPVDQITEADMVEWLKWERSRKAAPKTVKNVHGFISSVFDHAVRQRLRPDNPCNARMLPKDDSTQDAATFLTMPEYALVDPHLPEWSRPLFRLLIGSGLRVSEALALTPEDVMLDAATPQVRITRSWHEDRDADARWFIGPPKTRAARRTVALAPSTVAAIRERVESTAPGECIFKPSTSERPPGIRAVQRAWAKGVAGARAGDPALKKKPRIHDLRHSHASLMLATGMNLYELAQRLGHEDISTTTGTYGHLVPDAHFRAAAMVEQALAVES